MSKSLFALPMASPRNEDRPKDECGVFGVYSPNEHAAALAYFGLFALQHRGQESAGIAASDGQRVRLEKGMGLVSRVFSPENLEILQGDMAVGHTRYSTTGGSVLPNAGPVYCQSKVGEIAVAHNGNLINTRALREQLEAEGIIFNSTSDSEVLARIFVKHIAKGPEEAVKQVMNTVKGAYSVAILTPKSIIGFRDPVGIRPLSVGTVGNGYLLASETCAFGPVGGKVVKDLGPGEMVVIDKAGMRFSQITKAPRNGMCLFEFIYFARPDSIMYDTLLYSARERMGKTLAIEHPVDADLIIPVPDSGIPAALGFAEQTGIPFKEGMVKSRYIHRTFIQPSQAMRERGVRMKLTPLDEHVRGQRIVLVDDSIVRGTTTGQIVKMMFDAGAKEVHVRITAPPIIHPCFYGIDMASRDKLVAANMSIEELTTHIGATSLGFLSIAGATAAVNPNETKFCLACFNGDYPIPVDEDQSKEELEKMNVTGNVETILAAQGVLISDDEIATAQR